MQTLPSFVQQPDAALSLLDTALCASRDEPANLPSATTLGIKHLCIPQDFHVEPTYEDIRLLDLRQGVSETPHEP